MIKLLSAFWMIVKGHMRVVAFIVATVTVLSLGIFLGYGCGSHSRDSEVSSLSTKIAENEKTVEIKDGLYATTIVQMHSIDKLLDTGRSEVAALKKQLEDSKTKLLTTQQLAVTWKKAYEGAVNAHQTPVGPSQTDPKITRQRVDFSKDLGPIGVTGYTMTDPPEGFVSIKQLRPLKLTVSVAKNTDGIWQSYVTSSEPGMAVNVVLGAVDPGILDPSWYQMIWVDLGVDFIGGHGASVGLSYRGDRWSLGANCSALDTGNTCGLTVGFRPFK